jgi:hypothetical protein
VSFAAITLCIASQRVFIVVSVYFVMNSVRKLLDIPSYGTTLQLLSCNFKTGADSVANLSELKLYLFFNNTTLRVTLNKNSTSSSRYSSLKYFASHDACHVANRVLLPPVRVRSIGQFLFITLPDFRLHFKWVFLLKWNCHEL